MIGGVILRISEIFKLGVTQIQLDFIDIDTDIDYPLYIDPYLISIMNDPWTTEVDRTIKSFFNKVTEHIRSKKYSQAIELFQFMSEPKETCLGVSSKGTRNGKGVGEENAGGIIREIINSKAIEKGIVQNIEDLVVLVDDIDKDKLSDMTTNIIRKHLIDYTKLQCDIWGIPMKNAETLPYWNPQIEDWDNSSEDLLFYKGRELLLVPKSIVSFITEYNAQKYDWHFVITRERNEHLRRQTSLVKFKKYKNGREKVYLPKKDVSEHISNKIKNGEFINKKDYLRQYTQNHPELFETFRKSTSKKVEPLSNEEFMEYTGKVDVEELIDLLKNNLKGIPLGTENASRYHKFIKGILEIIFYPFLSNPTIEEKIHQGRKRIDIVMNNIANRGFFHRLHDINKVFCPYVFIECKNYSRDIANPELDQLSGRFSFNRGVFGILMCREIEDKELLYQRCSDTYRDGRGLIIPLDDNDIINMLEVIKTNSDYESILEAIKSKIMLNG